MADQLVEGATGVFGEATRAEPKPNIDVKTLHAKIGELTLENDFLSDARGSGGIAKAENHLENTRWLFKQTQLPQSSTRQSVEPSTVTSSNAMVATLTV